MSIVFNVDEVLRMAEHIESNGAAFYRKAAGLRPQGRDCGFLLKLAEMEDEHRNIFADMRRKLSESEKEPTAYDPSSEAGQYLAAMSDAHGGEGAPEIAKTLTGKEPLAQILRTAVELEKKSVLFYLGLLDIVPPRLGRNRVEKIINQEKGHIVILSRELQALKTA